MNAEGILQPRAKENLSPANGTENLWAGSIEEEGGGAPLLPPGLLLTTQHHRGLGGGGGPTPPTHPGPTQPPVPVKYWPNFPPGIRPIKIFLWRLQRQLVSTKKVLRRL